MGWCMRYSPPELSAGSGRVRSTTEDTGSHSGFPLCTSVSPVVRANLILPQRRHWDRNAESGGRSSHPVLASSWRKRAAGPIALAPSRPEHVSEHTRGGSRARRSESLHETRRRILIGVAEVIAVG